MTIKKYFTILSLLFLGISSVNGMNTPPKLAGAAQHLSPGRGLNNMGVQLGISVDNYRQFYGKLAAMQQAPVADELIAMFSRKFDPEGFNGDAAKLVPSADPNDGLSLAQIILLNHYAKNAFVKLTPAQLVNIVHCCGTFFSTPYGFSFLYGWMLNRFNDWKYFDWNYEATTWAMINKLPFAHDDENADKVKNVITQAFRASGQAVNGNPFLFSIHSIPRLEGVPTAFTSLNADIMENKQAFAAMRIDTEKFKAKYRAKVEAAPAAPVDLNDKEIARRMKEFEDIVAWVLYNNVNLKKIDLLKECRDDHFNPRNFVRFIGDSAHKLYIGVPNRADATLAGMPEEFGEKLEKYLGKLCSGLGIDVVFYAAKKAVENAKTAQRVIDASAYVVVPVKKLDDLAAGDILTPWRYTVRASLNTPDAIKAAFLNSVPWKDSRVGNERYQMLDFLRSVIDYIVNCQMPGKDSVGRASFKLPEIKALYYSFLAGAASLADVSHFINTETRGSVLAKKTLREHFLESVRSR